MATKLHEENVSYTHMRSLVEDETRRDIMAIIIVDGKIRASELMLII